MTYVIYHFYFCLIVSSTIVDAALLAFGMLVVIAPCYVWRQTDREVSASAAAALALVRRFLASNARAHPSSYKDRSSAHLIDTGPS